ncbi:MAG: small multi-drug export protein [Clostridiales bacterium]|nr:small multi-drug export protein [Clostridiales bacterium]
MVESITDSIVEFFSGTLPKEVIIFIISMMPVLELRGGMIAAKLLDVQLAKAFVICYIGNILPVPFILIFIRKIFDFLKKYKPTKKIVDKIEYRSMRKSEKVLKYRRLGLLMFVAIPVPGTGGWTGAILASLLDMRIKSSLPLIILGVLIADCIMTLLSYGLLGIFV